MLERLRQIGLRVGEIANAAVGQRALHVALLAVGLARDAGIEILDRVAILLQFGARDARGPGTAPSYPAAA